MPEPVIRLETNAATQIMGLRGKLSLLQHEQLPVAMNWAINRTLRHIKKYVQVEMHETFKKVRQFTEDSIAAPPVAVGELTSEVYFKRKPGKYGEDTTPYLKPEQIGGARPQKVNELLITEKGIISSGDVLVPAKGVEVNGNMPFGLYTKILSALQAFRQVGYVMNKSQMGKSNKATADIFIGVPRGHSLFAIYSRGAISGKFMPIMFRLKTTHYKKIFPFYQMAENEFNKNIGVNFNASFADALDKVGLGGSGLGLPGTNALYPQDS